MKYRSFNYHQVNQYSRTKSRRSLKRPMKSIFVVVSIAIILFGLKLIFSPVMGVIADIVRESTAKISYLIGTPEIRQDEGVTNILVLGIDKRYLGGPMLTDTIMIASYHHETEKVTLVSFPRDLWVQVPSFDSVNSYYTKINAIYSIGEERGYEGDVLTGGGSGLLIEVINELLGIPIHYFVTVNFDGFKQMIDAVGGIDIYAEQAFTDYQYPREGYENATWDARWEVVSFEQGWQHMDGETALQFARSRHALGSEGSDFARAKRQQKIIGSLIDKLQSSETLLDLSKLRNLYLTLSTEFGTNITLAEIPSFYRYYSNSTGMEDIENIVLSDRLEEGGLLYAPNPADFGGAFVLLPKDSWDDVATYIKQKLYLGLNNGEN